MNKQPMFIKVVEETKSVVNPYYSNNNHNIEAPFINETTTKIGKYYYSEKELLSDPSFINPKVFDKGYATFYRIQEISADVKVTVAIKE